VTTGARDDLACRELVELASDYLDGVLTPAAAAVVEAHLAACDDCRRYLEQLRLTIRGLGHAPPEEFPAGAREELLRRFRAWRAERGLVG
jgi:anti-sigma factor RsiW